MALPHNRAFLCGHNIAHHVGTRLRAKVLLHLIRMVTARERALDKLYALVLILLAISDESLNGYP